MKKPVKPIEVYRVKKLVEGQRLDEELRGFYAPIPEQKFLYFPIRLIYWYSRKNDYGTDVYVKIDKEVQSTKEISIFRTIKSFTGEPVTYGFYKVAEELK